MLDGDGAAGAKFGLGQPALRREDDRFLRGAGRYVDDIRLDGQLYAAVARSAAAHGVLNGVDVDAARAAPGVAAVYTGADLVSLGLSPFGNEAPVKSIDGVDPAPVKQPHLALDRVRHVGQPIAFVVAQTAAQARDAAALVEADVTPLPVVVHAADAVAPNAPQLHAAAPENRALVWETGDAAAAAAAFARTDVVVVRAAVRNQRLIVFALEPRAINAAYDARTERWTVYCATQGSHAMRGRLAAQLGVAPDRIRVITPDVGGGFGMKLMIHPEYALAAAAAKALGQPVTWTADRSESFLSDAQARDLETAAEAAFTADGALVALRARSFSNLGAYYSQYGGGIHSVFSGNLLGGMYRYEVGHNRVEAVFTNTTPTDAYRGAGRPEIIYITERLMEAGARALGLDPAAIRLKNLLTAADMPYRQPVGGGRYDSGDCRATLERALEAADYRGAAARKAAARARGAGYGVGVCYYMERTGGGPAENAEIVVTGDGRVVARIGTQSTGQGHETAWSQLIAAALGVNPNVIDFPAGDSDALPAGGGTGGSRSLIMAHRVFAIAADAVVERGKPAAAELLEAAIGDVEFTPAEGGRFRVAGTDRSVSLFDAAAAVEGGAIIGFGGVTEREATFPNGAHVAEVEIDLETGRPRLVSYVIVDDFGAVLNPLLVAGQVHGGVAQGVGQALFEGAVFDSETGQLLTGSLMDYQLPRAADLPFFGFSLTPDAPAKTNPMGVKGCGEAGAVAGIPAATLAVADALRDLGAEAPENPLTPVKIWTALQAAKAAAGRA